jgi:hypothetical protein
VLGEIRAGTPTNGRRYYGPDEVENDTSSVSLTLDSFPSRGSHDAVAKPPQLRRFWAFWGGGRLTSNI